jgi:hypothetical protein
VDTKHVVELVVHVQSIYILKREHVIKAITLQDTVQTNELSECTKLADNCIGESSGPKFHVMFHLKVKKYQRQNYHIYS